MSDVILNKNIRIQKLVSVNEIANKGVICNAMAIAEIHNRRIVNVMAISARAGDWLNRNAG